MGSRKIDHRSSYAINKPSVNFVSKKRLTYFDSFLPYGLWDFSSHRALTTGMPGNSLTHFLKVMCFEGLICYSGYDNQKTSFYKTSSMGRISKEKDS